VTYRDLYSHIFLYRHLDWVETVDIRFTVHLMCESSLNKIIIYSFTLLDIKAYLFKSAVQ